MKLLKITIFVWVACSYEAKCGPPSKGNVNNSPLDFDTAREIYLAISEPDRFGIDKAVEILKRHLASDRRFAKEEVLLWLQNIPCGGQNDLLAERLLKILLLEENHYENSEMWSSYYRAIAQLKFRTSNESDFQEWHLQYVKKRIDSGLASKFDSRNAIAGKLLIITTCDHINENRNNIVESIKKADVSIRFFYVFSLYFQWEGLRCIVAFEILDDLKKGCSIDDFDARSLKILKSL